MSEEKKSFPLLLEQFRKASRLSKTELARLANLTPGYISHLTRGERTAPSEEVVNALVVALRLDQGHRRALFEAAGYGMEHGEAVTEDLILTGERGIIEVREDWGEAPGTEYFYGRDKDLAQLEVWIEGKQSSVVAILGMGGVGKTTLAVKLARQIQGHFEIVFWRSLQNEPPLKTILKDCLLCITQPAQIEIPDDENGQIALLKGYLQTYSCLIILDNLESILQEGSRIGQYKAGHEGYGKLIEVVAGLAQQSSLLLTSREKPREVMRLEGEHVRSLQLAGVELHEAQDLLREKNLLGDSEAWKGLLHLYSGNPLALKMVSTPIRELFAGDIASFLQQGGAIISDIQDLLEEQFLRLSEKERELLYWLAIEREPVTLNGLREDTVQPLSNSDLLEALDALRRRSWIEVSGVARFLLQPVIMEYVTHNFAEQIFQEILENNLKLFRSHALIKAQAKDYIRESQENLILKPLAQRLLIELGNNRRELVLNDLLTTLHEQFQQTPGYSTGNLLNLLIQSGYNLSDYDFSNLVIWQAYLQGVELPGVNFSYADLSRSIFTDTFGGVLAIALNPKGDLLAAGTTNSEIRIWHLADGTPVLSCEGHEDWVRSVAFSPDGRLLASGSDDQKVRLWYLRTGQCFQTLDGHVGRVYAVAFNANGTLLASGSEDQTVCLWRIDEEQQSQPPIILREHSNRVRAVAFSADGRFLASAGEDENICIWKVEERGQASLYRRIESQHGKIYSVAFSPLGSLLASGHEDHEVRLWQIETGAFVRKLSGHTRTVRAVTFSPNGKMLASGSIDQNIRFWDVESGRALRVLAGHNNLVMSVHFNTEGDLLVSGSEDQTMRVWDVNSGKSLKILQGHSTLRYGVIFNPDGTLLANGNEDKTVRIWDVESGETRKVLAGHAGRIRAVAFSPDGKQLASGSDDRTLRFWDVRTGRCSRVVQGHRDRIKGIAFRPDGKQVASGSDDRTIRLWDVRTGRCDRILEEHTDWVWSVAFDRTGKFLVSGSEDQNVCLWEVASGECLYTFSGHQGAIWSVVFSPDGRFIASGSWDGTIRLWDIQSRECLRSLEGHQESVESVTFSPDGKLIASGGWDQTARLWNVASGECTRVLRGHSSWLYSVSFRPDGRMVASSSGDGTMKLWNVSTGECERTFEGTRPYEHMNITGVTGLNEAQKETLKSLGAFEE